MCCEFNNRKFKGHKLCRKGHTSAGAAASDDYLKNDLYAFI